MHPELLNFGEVLGEWTRPRTDPPRWEGHLSGKRNWQYSLWSVLMFNAWLQHETGW